MTFATSDINVDEVLSKLTLAEKVQLLSARDWWRTHIINREGVFVPQIKTTDGPNGARGESYVSGIRAACFPCATSLGSTFDVDLLFRIGVEVAKEAKSKSADVLLAPTCNIIRSPLGGRNYETYSEDPIVLGLLGAAYVNGCQSQGIAATPKHFVANEAENKRMKLSVQVDEQTLRELYLYPFQIIMKLCDPLCFMTSYNRVNEEYVSDSRRLIEDILRKEWGFSGLVMSDWMGTYSTSKALSAGLDLEMPGPSKWRGEKMLKSIQDGEISEALVDLSVSRVLTLAKKLGCFEHPDERPEIEAVDPDRDAFIANAAAEGMVLLKNDNNVLPLPPNASIALVGYHAKVVSLGGGGSARVDAIHAVSPIEAFNDLNITYEPGVPVFGAVPHAPASTISKTGGGKEAKPVMLEWFNGKEIGKNLACREMIPVAEYMIKEAWPSYLQADYCTRMTYDLTPETTGEHTFAISTTGVSDVFINDQLVFHRPQQESMRMEEFYFYKVQLERRFTYSMIAGQTYHIRVESWATDPKTLAAVNGWMFQGAALRYFEFVDIPASIQSAAETARKSDYAVVCIGTSSEVESEGYDRETLELLGEQYALVAAVVAANPKTVVVNFSGAPVNLHPCLGAMAIVQAWFPGQECGLSLRKVLTGEVNPGGRLPFSWPNRLEDNPSYGNFPAGDDLFLRYEEGLDVGYRYYDNKKNPDPLFPFGFGLSYTTFSISDSKISSASILQGPQGTIEITSSIGNTGSRSGKCAVQYYVQFPDTKIGQARPFKELKAFNKVEVEVGESKISKIVLDKYSVSFYDSERACWSAQKGIYTVHIGTSVVDIVDTVKFDVAEDFTWTGV